uniref:Ubiquinol-cytochrome c chaperone domain-containing protein n=1 Tax=Populus davidiana TaxID=266767 RepID=A0A6M2EXI3_9ROSI
MLARCSRAASSHFFHQLRNNNNSKDAAFKFISHQSYFKAATAAAMAASPILSSQKVFPSNSVVNLDKIFRSKPCSLALAPDSPLRIEEPEYEGIRRFVLKLLLFYSKQSKSIRGANVVYRRIVSQVDRPAIYEVFNLEKTFKMTFSLLVLHMWLCLRRLKQEGKEGVEFGQYIYEIYNHDVELRVSKAGVNLLLTKWMKELEKILYGNIVAYDAAMLPEAKPDELPKVIWRNVFSDDGTTEPDDTASQAIQAMARYVRHEASCLSLTDKEAMFSGNFMFTSLENLSSHARR